MLTSAFQRLNDSEVAAIDSQASGHGEACVAEWIDALGRRQRERHSGLSGHVANRQWTNCREASAVALDSFADESDARPACSVEERVAAEMLIPLIDAGADALDVD